MPERNSRSSARVVGLLAAATTGVVLVLIFQDSQPPAVAPVAQAGSGARKIEKPAPRDPLPADFEALDKGSVRGFALILNQAVIREPEGADRVVALEPPATPATLRSRLRDLDLRGRAFPLCRETDAAPDATPRIVTSELLLKLGGREAEPPVLPAGVRMVGRPEYAPEYLLVTAIDPFAALAVLPALREIPGVVSADIQLASWRQPRAMPSDPLVAQQWHLKYQNQAGALAGTSINVENAWLFGTNQGVEGTAIRVGVVDDGLETAHPDLAANVDTLNDWDWNGDDADPNPAMGNNHGTACAGNVAALADNGLGGCGSAPEARLVGLRLIAAATTDSQEASAMNHLVTGTNLLHLKTNSWGPSDNGTTLEAPGPLTRAAFANAVTQGRGGLGMVFLWAGGNGHANEDNSNYDGYANDPHVLAIGASDSHGNQAYYSEPGANLTCVAPSGGTTGTLGITTTDRVGNFGYAKGDYYTAFSGTSSATPTAAGVVALILQKNPALGWRDVKEILLRSAAKISPADSDWSDNAAGLHFNHKFGAGLIDATAAVTLAENWINLPPTATASDSLDAVPAAIPDNNATGITRTFVIGPDPLRVEHVAVTLQVSHTYRGDLAITLTSPSGMTSRLAETHSDGASDYNSWTFGSVRHWGELSPGVWTLKIADLAAVDTGTLNSATLAISGIPTTFAGWIATFPGLGDVTAGGDPDHDGLPSLTEYYLGGRPDRTDPLHRQPRVAVASGFITFDWWHPKFATGTTSRTETSTALTPESWTPAAAPALLSDNGNAEHYQLSLPIVPEEPSRFLRLNVTSP